ncbi:hypothetical protein GWG65_39740 [Bradyrhizobium sp. CSA207]|uniref:hypothetical protein n=1 Tax=Bradyrhizobium sp. CSA207 TaxID=2698826 RepID=UPI0023B0B733|nr:hypothetical protein [Bradyrhizobium sp. CSA207]MDE5447327.1 hypothetical protein [Bradyrhizobium sp. CSA207]
MTRLLDQLQVSRVIQLHDDAAAQNGIKLLLGFDFHEYISITRVTPTKAPTFPNFRPDRSPIKSGQGYWIIGVDKDDEIALSDAARLYDLSCTNFAEHLQSLNAFYAQPALHAHPQDRCTCIAPSARNMTGKVAYNGDLWVRGDFRGTGLAQIITQIAHRVSFAMWAPDFLCALVARWRVVNGIPQYCHQEPGGAILQLVEEDVAEDDWLVWLTGEELRNQRHHDESKSLLAPPLCR